MQAEKRRAPRNRTLNVSPEEQGALGAGLLRLTTPSRPADLADKIIYQDVADALPHLPPAFVDLLVLDPPYNLNKEFGGLRFRALSDVEYREWFLSWFSRLMPLLRPTASVYVCADWRTSYTIQPILEEHLCIRNRITWEREKGRGATTNWKNCSEDIWFCTVSERYTFQPDAVRLKRRVIAPYRDAVGEAKDWEETEEGRFRLTAPSNLWTDITVPFWSMPENTDHPTQKPEKLIAKMILASSRPGDMVLDPFLGSGTTAVVAKKLGRRFVGIERDETFCCLAAKRLLLAETAPEIQGYRDGVFYERNSIPETAPARPRARREPSRGAPQPTQGALFRPE